MREAVIFTGRLFLDALNLREISPKADAHVLADFPNRPGPGVFFGRKGGKFGIQDVVAHRNGAASAEKSLATVRSTEPEISGGLKVGPGGEAGFQDPQRRRTFRDLGMEQVLGIAGTAPWVELRQKMVVQDLADPVINGKDADLGELSGHASGGVFAVKRLKTASPQQNQRGQKGNFFKRQH